MKIIRMVQISFLFLICQACSKKEPSLRVTILWENEKAKALIIEGIESTSPENQLSLRLEGNTLTPMLGEYSRQGNQIIFEPLVPLTRGLTYEILVRDSIIAEIQIPLGDSPTPRLLSIYPTNDTLPENLLKFYFQFSESMEEGHSLQNVFLINATNDTLSNTFLDLQPELWNAGGTLLTLWLDPGRIKRDLQPNLKLGAPLVRNQHYSLNVSSTWKSKAGVALGVTSKKEFTVALRDELSPNPKQWNVLSPKSRTKEPLQIKLKESLDYALLMEAIQLIDNHEREIAGLIQLEDEERTIKFIPKEEWSAGVYKIRVESRMEDLAGNNINRLFEQDLTKESKSPSTKFLEINFSID